MSVAPGRLRVSGWALDPDGPLDRAVLLVGADAPARVILGRPRPDVAEAHPEIAHAESSGLQCDVDLRAAKPGPLPIELPVRTADGRWLTAAAVTVTVAADPAAAAPRRRGAAFTVVQNEAVMLPLWLEYYGRHFPAGDLYGLDHNTTDGSTEAIDDRCRRVPIHWNTSFDHRRPRKVVGEAPGIGDDELVGLGEQDGLLLVHLHRVDYDWCLERHRSRASRDWSQEDITRRDGWQNRVADPTEFDAWFRAGPDIETPREVIPEHIRAIL